MHRCNKSNNSGDVAAPSAPVRFIRDDKLTAKYKRALVDIAYRSMAPFYPSLEDASVSVRVTSTGDIFTFNIAFYQVDELEANEMLNMGAFISEFAMKKFCVHQRTCQKVAAYCAVHYHRCMHCASYIFSELIAAQISPHVHIHPEWYKVGIDIGITLRIIESNTN